MDAAFLEKFNLATALVPVDLNAGANTGLRISMKNFRRITFVVIMADSTAAVTDLTLNQHTASTAGTSKALSILNPYYTKAGAETVFTRVVPSVAASNFVPTAFANEPGLLVFEVLAEDLDVENGYAWLSLSAIDATAAKIGGILAIGSGPTYKPAYSTAFVGTA